MALDATIIKKRLSSVPRIQRDNEAQNIIKEATPGELKRLDVESIMQLYEALTMLGPRIYSNNDASAIRKLKINTQFQPVTKTPDFGVNLVKKANPGSPFVQSQLSPELVTRIYAAEKKRFSLLEKMGIDGSTIGRGQLGQSAYDDVKSPRHFKSSLEKCLSHVFLSKALKNAPRRPANSLDFKRYKINIPKNYNTILSYPSIEDFIVAAYLAIRITAATKAGRSPKDVMRFSVALYHGMYHMVVAAQNATNDKINWTPIEVELLKRGHKDEVDYVHEIVK